MKVSRLIELLQQSNQDAEVLLSSDEEGNAYAPWEGYAVGNFDKDEGTPLDPYNRMGNMQENEIHGDYIILYPR